VLDQRLFSEVRDLRGLAYSTGAGLAFTRQSYGRIWLTTESPLEALPVVRSVVADLKSKGPDERELETARAALRTEILVDSTTVAGQASLLSDWTMTAGSRQAVDDMLASLDSVSAADLSAALSYLDGAKTTAAGPGGALSVTDLTSLFATPQVSQP
jgi:predicted Zn-dependent peptidase